MADAPWRCSECGTVNEPVANACRTCGRWPSLFDLEQSKIDVLDADPRPANEPAPEDFEVEAYEELPVEPVAGSEPVARSEPVESESPSARGWRTFGRLVVPVAVVIYLVITTLLNR